MSASILYKFRSSTTFEALPLPGTAARLFDVKKAIVVAKKLDKAGSFEFDLSIRDATTNEEYADENMLLPRGTRLIVQRLPAARGHGFLTRMARNPYGGTGTQAPTAPTTTAPSNFYTIDSRANADEEEFVSSSAVNRNDEDRELAALRAATDAGRGDMRLHVSASTGGGGFRPPPGVGRGNNNNSNFVQRQRPNADPELREQEKQMMPKKRATGIPRTFLNLNAPPATDGTADGEANVPLLQPNAIGFEELVNRGGGQSENASNKNRLDYALKLTAMTVPEYLQCAICHNVVKDAMILPWDGSGRTTCESCIRDALTQNGFRCPLTGQEGVSPDDLLPNLGLRMAAEQFIKGVMEKMEEITKQQIDEDDDDDFNHSGNGKVNLLEGDNADKGVIISKKTTARKKQQEEEDPFGGDDEFGGDVFAVDTDDKQEEKEKTAEEPVKPVEVKQESVENKAEAKKEDRPVETRTDNSNTTSAPDPETQAKRHDRSLSPAVSRGSTGVVPRDPNSSRRDRRRGPPVGYSMGPAGGAALGPREDSFSPRNNGRDGRDERGRDHEARSTRDTDPRARDADPRARDTDPRARDTDPRARDTDPRARDADPRSRDSDSRVRDSGSHARNDRYSRDDRYGRDDDRYGREGNRENESAARSRNYDDVDNNSISSERDRDRGSKRPRSGSDYEDPSEDSRYRRYNDSRSHGRYDERRGESRGRAGRGGPGRFEDRGGNRGGGFRGRGRGGYRGRGRY